MSNETRAKGINPKILILGFGRLGRAFFRLFASQYEVRGISRNPDPGEHAHVTPITIQSEALIPLLKWADVVIFSPSSGGRNLDEYRQTYLENLKSVIRWIHAHSIPIRLFILIGSTGVYPKERDGIWTEEGRVPAESPRQEILLSTEQTLIESDLNYVILRCGGLYGEGRANFGQIRRAGKILSSEMTGQFFPLIHQDDVCGVIHRVIASDCRRTVYNLVDDSNLSRGDLYAWIANETGIQVEDDGPAPPLPDRSIPNKKLKRELNYEFQRPSVTNFLKNHLSSKK